MDKLYMKVISGQHIYNTRLFYYKNTHIKIHDSAFWNSKIACEVQTIVPKLFKQGIRFYKKTQTKIKVINSS